MTRGDVGFDNPKATTLRIVLAATALVVFYFVGGLDSALQEIGGILMAFLIFIAWVGLVFLINLTLAPWQLQKEADAKIAALEKRLDDREKQQNALDRLWQLRSDGIALRNQRVKTEAEFLDWQRRYERWRENTLEAAGERSANLRGWLERLERMGAPPFGLEFYSDDSGKSEHFRLASIMTEVLVRLQKHLKKDLT